jgi:Thermostable hemolysin
MPWSGASRRRSQVVVHEGHQPLGRHSRQDATIGSASRRGLREHDASPITSSPGFRVPSHTSVGRPLPAGMLRESRTNVCSRHTLATYDRDHPRRETLERFIQRAFALRHGAMIRSFMPTLLALEGQDDRVCGVAGLRNAATEPLFIETLPGNYDRSRAVEAHRRARSHASRSSRSAISRA